MGGVLLGGGEEEKVKLLNWPLLMEVQETERKVCEIAR